MTQKRKSSQRPLKACRNFARIRKNIDSYHPWRTFAMGAKVIGVSLTGDEIL
jgi:hypothetical protein